MLPPSPFPRLPHLLPMQLNSREGGLPAGRVDRAGCAASFSLPQMASSPSHAAGRVHGLPAGGGGGGWIGMGVLPPSPFPRLPHLLPMQLNSRECGLPAGRVDIGMGVLPPFLFPRLPHPLPMQQGG